ncbi:Tip20p SCDLUD_002706 [Saccharomycodes ludwigii]|uniref:Tip20p n=1 Tax=Saccharomycodes ludwigii TaxID=36035 RepID=UPI001E887C87|nr:hypothetical protein SCDLUD_002706 [Saccharomycodes ludwigii]KAH3901220.1 hypothetical protein SCDLUD_002706 [Saccharomycodes ludwigii]
MEISTIDDFVLIDNELKQIELKREELATTIPNLSKKAICDEKPADVSNEINSSLVYLASDLSHINQLSDLDQLVKTYGASIKNLETYQHISQVLHERQLEQENLNLYYKTNEIDSKVKNLSSVDEFYNLINTTILSDPLISTNIKDVLKKSIESKINEFKKTIIPTFQQLLLNSNWDKLNSTESRNNGQYLNKNVADSMKKYSDDLFKISLIYNEIMKPEIKQYFNFDCIANNFNIKFIYHFNSNIGHNDNNPTSELETQTIDTYFKFLHIYLSENLYKCISIFHNEDIGLTKELCHQQFINHILNPIRKKIQATLNFIVKSPSDNNLNHLVVLISQIFITDNTLWKIYYYDYYGLVSLIPENVLQTWVDFESTLAQRQFKNFLTSGLNNLLKNGPDFVKYLESLFEYFTPLFSVNLPNFFNPQIQVFRNNFLQLIQLFKDFNINYNSINNITDATGINTAGSLGNSDMKNDEELQFKENVVRLRNMQLVYDVMIHLENKPDCIKLTNIFNKKTKSTFGNLFSGELINYKESILALNESLVHRFKKMFGASLRTYFKIDRWNSTGDESNAHNDNVTNTNTSCSPELFSSVSIVKKCVDVMRSYNLDSLNLEQFQSGCMSIIINYLTNYTLKLNEFSKDGLLQLICDYKTLKMSLGFQSGEIISLDDGSFLDTLKVYKVLKFYNEEKKSKWLDKNYIRKNKFDDLKTQLDIKYASNDEIAYILYKIV